MKPACMFHAPQIRGTASTKEEPSVQDDGIRSRSDGQQIKGRGKSWVGQVGRKASSQLTLYTSDLNLVSLVWVGLVPPTCLFLFCSHSPLFGPMMWLWRNSETMVKLFPITLQRYPAAVGQEAFHCTQEKKIEESIVRRPGEQRKCWAGTEGWQREGRHWVSKKVLSPEA